MRTETQRYQSAVTRAHLEKLVVVRLAEKFLSLRGTRQFITMFMMTHHWTPSSAK